MYMDALLSLRGRSGQQVRLQYVRGHAGEVGNEGADALAVRGAKLHEVEEPDWDTLRLRLLDEGPEPKRGAIADAELADSNISVSHLKFCVHIGRSLRTRRVERCMPTCCSMKMIFLQSSRKTRSNYVTFLIYISAYSVCRAQQTMCGDLPAAVSQPSGSLQIRGSGSAGSTGPLCRSAHAHLIAHATIVPSPYQDSLRRDGGQARWELGTRHHCACQFVSGSVRSWARTSTRIHGVVYRRRRDSESISELRASMSRGV
jgi:hypothetical protein